jgi:hypothetical protein
MCTILPVSSPVNETRGDSARVTFRSDLSGASTPIGLISGLIIHQHHQTRPTSNDEFSAGTPLNGPEPMRVVVGFVASTAP